MRSRIGMPASVGIFNQFFSFRKNLAWGVVLLGMYHSGVTQTLSPSFNDSLASRKLDEVIVSATRNARQLSSVPLNAQIISKEEIKGINSVRLSDILSEQTGLITVPDFGGGEGIQMQGFDSQYVLVMIDGVPLIGRSAGTLDLNRVSVGNIKQIEVVKGASSSLYGNEALGGIVNIITETPSGGFGGDINYRYGTLNAHDISSNLSFGNDRIQASAFINRNSGDGFDLREDLPNNTVEPFENYTVNPKVRYTISKHTNASLSARLFRERRDNAARDTLSGDANVNERNAHFLLNHIFNGKWDSYFEFYASQYRTDEFLDDPDGNRFSESEFNQRFIRPEFRTTYTHSDDHIVIMGAGFTRETLVRNDFVTDPVFNAPYAYIQYDGQYFDKLNVVLGARFDEHNAYQSQLSPKAAIRYDISKKIGIKGSVGYGYKAPDFRQLYFNFTNPAGGGYIVLGQSAVATRLLDLFQSGGLAASANDSSVNVVVNGFSDQLKAESSVNYNLGVSYNPRENIRLNFNLFRNNVENLIDVEILPIGTAGGANIFSYVNRNRVYTQGLELDATWQITNHFRITGGYQLLYAYDRDIKEASEANPGIIVRDPETLQSTRVNAEYFGLPNRSRHMANFKVFFHAPGSGIDANIRGTYRSKFGLTDRNGNGYIDDLDPFVAGHFIWDLAVNKGIKEHILIGFGIDNLLDFTDPVNITNIPGRLIYGKLNFNF